MRRAIIVLVAIAGMSIIAPSTANASSAGCTDGGIQGIPSKFSVCMLINGDGNHVDKFRVGVNADPDLGFGWSLGFDKKVTPGVGIESDYAVPTIRGCEVHANVRNASRSVDYNSPAIPCSELDQQRKYYKLSKWDSGAYYGVVFEFPLDRNLPKGKYCGIVWFKLNGEYHSGGASCRNIT